MMTAGAASAERIYCSSRHVDNIIVKSVLRFILFSYIFFSLCINIKLWKKNTTNKCKICDDINFKTRQTRAAMKERRASCSPDGHHFEKN